MERDQGEHFLGTRVLHSAVSKFLSLRGETHRPSWKQVLFGSGLSQYYHRHFDGSIRIEDEDLRVEIIAIEPVRSNQVIVEVPQRGKKWVLGSWRSLSEAEYIECISVVEALFDGDDVNIVNSIDT